MRRRGKWVRRRGKWVRRREQMGEEKRTIVLWGHCTKLVVPLPPPPPFSMAKTFFAPPPPFRRGKTSPPPISGGHQMMDVALLFDSSGSVQRENFPRLVQFAQSVVNDLYVSLEDTRVAAITFGTEAQVRGVIVKKF